ncbi:NAD(P)-dependent oxidoreductase [Brumimicrobium oceani]|uniref:NAD-dependent epimerase n=1 Tax=Brumimicrobium oceani TaxID=2100725 RepID=A0A2U2XHK1_9FLAO|nr:NAD(P)-binding oxidoreductase [Brumimicrobium oceani]PWH87220.1 NAD-dependent epimerase [Brumimicrobium oceani]
MKALVVGASGATGQHLVTLLLSKNYNVKIVVRSTENLPISWKSNKNLEIIIASILDFSDEEMQELTAECQAIISCLGHNLSFKGIYGEPRKLVTEATRRLCEAVLSNKPQAPTKYILMNTSGNRNLDLNEKVSFPEKIVIALLRLILPPHVDNEQAAEYLRTEIGQQNKFIEWTAVRPDDLINNEKITPYEIHPSPIKSAIFKAGKVSRINVAHFMSLLLTSEGLWEKWKGKMPVIYNKK